MTMKKVASLDQATPSPKKPNATRNSNARRNVETWTDPRHDLKPAGYFRDKVLRLFRAEDAEQGGRP